MARGRAVLLIASGLSACASRPISHYEDATEYHCRLPRMDPGVPVVEIEELTVHRASFVGRRVCARGVFFGIGLGSVAQTRSGHVDELVSVPEIPAFAGPVRDGTGECADLPLVACGIFALTDSGVRNVVGEIRNATVFFVPQRLRVFSWEREQ